jgi:tryptophanyl-tRNA synthetase
MIQFTEKGRGRPATRVSRYTYPALMAADILLYRPLAVPVGDGQRQHLGLTRALAARLDMPTDRCSRCPGIVTPTVGARILHLTGPGAKMGESQQERAGIIYLPDGKSGVTTSWRSSLRAEGPARPGAER